MHCSHCGENLTDGAIECTRCGADLSARARRHSMLVTLAFAVVSIAVVAIIVCLVLHWHESQVLVGP